jgi:hypothetical protein
VAGHLVTWIACHLATDPVRQGEALVLALQLDFGQDEAFQQPLMNFDHNLTKEVVDPRLAVYALPPRLRTISGLAAFGDGAAMDR